MKTVSINLYSFSELNDDAKNRAIDEHRDFMQSFPDEYENEHVSWFLNISNTQKLKSL